MRLPTKFSAQGRVIDAELGGKMIDFAYRHGINYYDTAWFYHDGQSEEFIGQALKPYPATAYSWPTRCQHRFWRISIRQRIFSRPSSTAARSRISTITCFIPLPAGRSLTGYIFRRESSSTFVRKIPGRIRCLGFSFHGGVPFFQYLVDQYPWDFCMIQLNYADWNDPGEAPSGSRQAGDLYRKCREKNVPIFVMEPVKGGNLADLPPSSEAILKEMHPDASMASWALRWVGSKEGVITMNSGMSNLEQVLDNIRTMSNFTPLSSAEERAIQRSLGKSADSAAIPCTYCRYCDPCPYGVDIATVFQLYNRFGNRLASIWPIRTGQTMRKNGSSWRGIRIISSEISGHPAVRPAIPVCHGAPSIFPFPGISGPSMIWYSSSAGIRERS